MSPVNWFWARSLFRITEHKKKNFQDKKKSLKTQTKKGLNKSERNTQGFQIWYLGQGWRNGPCQLIELQMPALQKYFTYLLTKEKFSQNKTSHGEVNSLQFLEKLQLWYGEGKIPLESVIWQITALKY